MWLDFSYNYRRFPCLAIDNSGNVNLIVQAKSGHMKLTIRMVSRCGSICMSRFVMVLFVGEAIGIPTPSTYRFRRHIGRCNARLSSLLGDKAKNKSCAESQVN